MEEASLDQGFDRLPFFLFLALVWASVAEATTFGPINVTEQIRKSQYFLHGRIRGAGWVEMERRLQRPFTHWRLQVLDQPVGSPVGNEVTIRQPGGEIGDLGYHVAGSAKFTDGEEVFVNVRDTDEANVKEVVGLASGKYSVAPGADGKPQVRSGLGFPVRDAGGKAMSPKEFLSLAERIADGRETEQDRNLMLNNKAVHDHDTVLERMTNEALALKEQGAKTASPTVQGGTNDTTQSLNSAQESPGSADEPKKGIGAWWMIFAGIAALAATLILRKR